MNWRLALLAVIIVPGLYLPTRLVGRFRNRLSRETQESQADLLEYAQFLQSVSHLVILDPQFRAPLRDPTDLIVLQTAEKGEADILCTNDADFYDQKIFSYGMARGIEVCHESRLIERLLQGS